MTSEELKVILSAIKAYIDFIVDEEQTGGPHISHDTITQNIVMEIENLVPMNMAMIEDELGCIRQHILATNQILKENRILGSLKQYVTVTPMPNNTSVIEGPTSTTVSYFGGYRVTFLKSAKETHDVFITVDMNGYIKVQHPIKEELAALDRRDKEETKKNKEKEDKLGRPYIDSPAVHILKDKSWSKGIDITIDQNGIFISPTPQDISEIQINDKLTNKAINEAKEAEETIVEEKPDITNKADPFEYTGEPDVSIQEVAELIVESIKEHQIKKPIQSLNRITEIIEELIDRGYSGSNINRVIEYAVDTLHFNQIKASAYDTFEVDAAIFEPVTKVKPGIYIAVFQKYQPRNRIELMLSPMGLLYIHSK